MIKIIREEMEVYLLKVKDFRKFSRKDWEINFFCKNKIIMFIKKKDNQIINKSQILNFFCNRLKLLS
jgi:hypothetical protein